MLRAHFYPCQFMASSQGMACSLSWSVNRGFKRDPFESQVTWTVTKQGSDTNTVTCTNLRQKLKDPVSSGITCQVFEQPGDSFKFSSFGPLCNSIHLPFSFLSFTVAVTVLIVSNLPSSKTSNFFRSSAIVWEFLVTQQTQHPSVCLVYTCVYLSFPEKTEWVWLTNKPESLIVMC